ncbi:MAG: trypsin-like peptidase domain-containing protein, partial [Myxococcota bacterium]
MSDIRVLAAALSLGATIVSGCASGGGSGAAPGPTQVGEEVPLSLRSPAYDATEDSRDAELVWRHEVSHAEATYIALHFSDFDLPAGAELSITTQDGSRRAMYTLSGKQLPVSGTVPIKGFWATHMPGDTAVIELHSSVSLSEGAVALDRFARGLPAWQELAADLPDPSLAGETEAICSTDDSLEAKCYQSSESAAYDKSRAVARLLLNGTGGCTGWLVGDEGHLMTNEHCIGNASTAANTDYEFMAEGADCSTDCRSGGACPGTVVATSASVVRINASLDYALVKLPVNPIATYGFMQMRESGGQVGERIYIPQHPARWGKRIAMKDGA